MNKCFLYLDGFTLGLALIIIVFCLICLAFLARDYIHQIKRADRLQAKYNICRADLSAAQLELQGIRMRQAGIISDSKPPMQKTPSVNSVDSSLNEGAISKVECPYKVEPGSGTPSVTHSRATFPKGEGREIASMKSGSTPTKEIATGAEHLRNDNGER